jgi:glucan biosynthesis protein
VTLTEIPTLVDCLEQNVRFWTSGRLNRAFFSLIGYFHTITWTQCKENIMLPEIRFNQCVIGRGVFHAKKKKTKKKKDKTITESGI